MPGGSIICMHNVECDAGSAVGYHYGRFPPAQLDLGDLLMPLARIVQSLTRYDERLTQLPNSELLLALLRQRDAVVSSRMEDRISTVEEVLRLEAGTNANKVDAPGRNETIEVALYARAVRQAEQHMREGYGLGDHVIRNAHQTLLSHGRGAEKAPGRYKTEQNYIGSRRHRRIDYVPIAPDRLGQGMRDLIALIDADGLHPLVVTAIAHAEFEALHPFEDGNGRVGRMLIPLTLWQKGVLSAPHFFASDYFEANKDEYIDRLRAVSAEDAWTAWIVFFLDGLGQQATANIEMLDRVRAHHAEMRERFRDVLRSQHFAAAVDYVFANPIFWNNHFVSTADAPKTTLQNFTSRLVDAGLLDTLVAPAGRAPGLHRFTSLIEIIDAP